MRFTFVKKPRFFVPLILILASAVLIFAVVRNMNQAAVGDINQTPQPDAIKSDPYGLPGTYKGKYIEFTYPPHYKKIASANSGSTLETVLLHTTFSTGQQIAVAVAPGNINGDSGVVFRRQQTKLYTETDSQNWTQFTKNDGTEHIFFIEHSGLLASVAATAPFNDQSGDALFVASSLKWR